MIGDIFSIPTYWEEIFGNSPIEAKLYKQNDEYLCDCMIQFSHVNKIMFSGLDFLQSDKFQEDGKVEFDITSSNNSVYKLRFTTKDNLEFEFHKVKIDSSVEIYMDGGFIINSTFEPLCSSKVDYGTLYRMEE